MNIKTTIFQRAASRPNRQQNQADPSAHHPQHSPETGTGRAEIDRCPIPQNQANNQPPDFREPNTRLIKLAKAIPLQNELPAGPPHDAVHDPLVMALENND